MIIAVTKTAHLNLIDTFDTLDTNKIINSLSGGGAGGRVLNNPGRASEEETIDDNKSRHWAVTAVFLISP